MALVRKIFQVTPVITRQMTFSGSSKILVFLESERSKHGSQIGAYCFVEQQEEEYHFVYLWFVFHKSDVTSIVIQDSHYHSYLRIIDYFNYVR